MSMRMSELVGSLPGTFISFGFLQKKSNVQERSQTREDQQLMMSTTSASAETVQTPGRDTSLKKKIMVLQCARPGCNTDEITA